LNNDKLLSDVEIGIGVSVMTVLSWQSRELLLLLNEADCTALAAQAIDEACLRHDLHSCRTQN
jgi:hypothetical protein